MLLFALCSLTIGLGGPLVAPAPTDSVRITVGNPTPLCVPATLDDTVRPRARAITVSEWYSRRLTIHRVAAFAIIPLFGAQWVAGEELFKKGSESPTWAKTGHRVGATALAGLFTVNTVTGLWNLWDSRAVPQDRTLRYVHTLSMLAADAAFTYAGSTLANEAETSLTKRREHRTVTLAAMGVTLSSALMMKIWNR